MSKMKSSTKLWSFIQYCLAHPDERFWQALRNWSKYEFIYVSSECATMITDDSVPDFINSLEDTFYKD